MLYWKKKRTLETQRIKFEAIQSTNYEVAKAWQVKENFKDLFAPKSDEVCILFSRWMQNAHHHKIKKIDKVVEMFKNHISGIIEALIYDSSNAMAEKLNGKIKEIKLADRGYRTFKNFRSAILFFHGDLSLYPLNWG